METTTKTPLRPFDYKTAAEAVLKTLKRDRDRQIIAKRFGFGLSKRQTLEKIGQQFGITRERVRQIEKATLKKIMVSDIEEIKEANRLLTAYLQGEGGFAPLDKIARKLGAETPQEQSYIVFLATLAPDIAVVDEDDQVRSTLALASICDKTRLKKLLQQLTRVVKNIGKPATLKTIDRRFEDISGQALQNLALINKQLANHEDLWGLLSWPEVNPKSIRDKTYLVLKKHGRPLHFTKIAEYIKNSTFTRRNVTVQAVHNELIKDDRFVLIGRGIYALAEWGYQPGTVADIIEEILKEESPLHKDEIVRRVLKRRQVKTTTIILNLQEKDQFQRVAKATYTLKKDPNNT